MRTLKALLLTIAISSFAGCGLETASHVNALTGETCEPNFKTYMPRDAESKGNVSPTGIPGDNLDDERSGKIDCLGDGNSGQGDDRKHNCQFPQPGCDDNGCCDGDIVVVPEQPEAEQPEAEQPEAEQPDEEQPDEETPPVIIL